MTKKPIYDSQIIVRCSQDLRLKIEKAAKKSDITITEWIRNTLKEKAEQEENKKYSLAEQKQMYVDSKLIDAIKYALTLPEVQRMIKDMLWKKNE
jgi:hypothetical protein